MAHEPEGPYILREIPTKRLRGSDTDTQRLIKNAPEKFNHLNYLPFALASGLIMGIGGAEGFHLVPDTLPLGFHNPNFLTFSPLIDLAVAGSVGLLGLVGTWIKHHGDYTNYLFTLRSNQATMLSSRRQ